MGVRRHQRRETARLLKSGEVEVVIRGPSAVVRRRLNALNLRALDRDEVLAPAPSEAKLSPNSNDGFETLERLDQRIAKTRDVIRRSREKREAARARREEAERLLRK